MKQCGVIISTQGDRARVMLQRQSSCGDCQGCKLGNENTKMEIEAINQVNAKTGDWVEIDMEHQNVLAAAFIAYALPLLALIAGIVVGSIVLDRIGLGQYKELGAGLLGLLLTAVTYLIIRLKEGSFRTNKAFVPIIIAITNK